MKNNIFIFGDSYADPSYKFEEYDTWHFLLTRYFADYDVKNFGRNSTGPHYSFKKLYDLLFKEKQIKENDVIIFVLSGNDRITFYGLDPYISSDIKWRLDPDIQNDEKLYCHDLCNSDVRKYFDENKEKIKFSCKTFEEEIRYLNAKNEAFLYYISRVKKCKIFLMFKGNPFEFYDSNLNDKNFYKLKESLFEISHFEVSKNEEEYYNNSSVTYSTRTDKRSNHLSKENHFVLFDLIKKFIENDNIDYKWNTNFKKLDDCFFPDDINDQKIDQLKGDFIYE